MLQHVSHSPAADQFFRPDLAVKAPELDFDLQGSERLCIKPPDLKNRNGIRGPINRSRGLSSPSSSRPISKRHQSFMAAAVLPGENPEEYTALFNEVWSDCKPVGPVEQSLVGGIASFLWRKRRLGIFRQAEAARKEFGACFADGDLAAGTANASHQRLEKEKRSLELISKLREGR